MKFRILAAALAATLLSACATLPANDNGVRTGTVASADPRAAAAGQAMLDAGGNSTDAAIATMLALTVVEPQSSGIGGGGFFVRGTADGKVETIDGRESAPAAATPQWFYGADGQPQGYRDVVLTGLSVGVPGNIALAAEAHRRHGSLPWAMLFGPAIALAEDGFRVNPRFHASLESLADRAGATAKGRELFYDGGAPRPVGTLIVNPDLAATFRSIAAGGPDAFYKGPIGVDVASTVAAATPGDARMSVADVEGYAAKERVPVCGRYRGYRICGMGPPSSGAIAVQQMLGQLERFDLAALGPDSPVFWQLFVDSQRLAYADRELYVGDDDYASVPTTGLIEPAYIAARSALLVQGRALGEAKAGVPRGADIALADGDEPAENGTSHFVAIDDAGTMISWTSTVEGGFGSGLMSGGFYLNNELTDFSFAPEADGKPVANRVEGGKRPRSSMAPTVIYDPQGRPLYALGAAGGSTIPVQVARSIVGLIDFDLSMRDALGLPLVFASGNTVLVEDGTPLAARTADIQALGYAAVRTASPPFRAVGAEWVDGRWVGAVDPRLDGLLDAPDTPVAVERSQSGA